jgi:Ca2+/Na+ antiporter
VKIENVIFDIADALLYPVLIAALLSILFVVVELGALFAELRKRRGRGLARLEQGVEAIRGAQLATQMGWGHSFVGSMFIAFATSLPEVVVTVGCVRQGATDLAIGNVLGSNLFNILILAIDDVFYVAGPLYAAVQPVHIVTAITSIMMTGVAVVGLLYHPRSRLFGIIGWVSASLIALYLFSAFVLYAHQH